MEYIARFNNQSLDFNEADFLLGTDGSDSKVRVPPFKFWLQQPKIRTNFIVVSFVWLIASFNFYLIAFLLTSFEQVYLSTIFSCMSDMLGYSTGGIIFAALNVKKTQMLGFSVATIGGIIILFYGLKHEGSWGFLFLIMIAKYGTTLSFGLNYTANSVLFPTLFAATALGSC